MKHTLILLVVMFLSTSVFSDSKHDVLCLQKDSPVTATVVNQTTNPEVKLKFNTGVKSFEIENIRGLDGLQISGFNLIKLEDLKMGSEISIPLNLDNQSGLQYLVVDFKYIRDEGQLHGSATAAVGKISPAQLQKSSNKIQEVKINKKGSTTTRRIHRMKLN
jgi:hypothetical protein